MVTLAAEQTEGVLTTTIGPYGLRPGEIVQLGGLGGPGVWTSHRRYRAIVLSRNSFVAQVPRFWFDWLMALSA